MKAQLIGQTECLTAYFAGVGLLARMDSNMSAEKVVIAERSGTFRAKIFSECHEFPTERRRGPGDGRCGSIALGGKGSPFNVSAKGGDLSIAGG